MIDAELLAQLVGKAPGAIAGLAGALPTSARELRRLARRLGVDYESLRTLADDALQPLTGFDADTKRLLRLWQKLDPKRKSTALAVLKDLAAASPRRRKR